MRAIKPRQCDEWDDDAVTFDTGHISQLRFTGDSFPVKNPPDIPEPRPMGLLAACGRANEGVPVLTPKRRRAKPVVKKKPVRRKR